MFRTLITTITLCFSLSSLADKPDFSQIDSVNDRKSAFFNYLYPQVLDANVAILKERESIMRAGPTEKLCTKYRVDCESTDARRKLLRKVDIILPSQALAQAAIESSWGRSRFAIQANNYFGVWCWTKNCGLTPRNRPEGHQYWVKKYPNTQASIADFMLNLNRHSAYVGFRKSREYDASVLSHINYLTPYSQEEQVYVEKVQGTITYNALERFDTQFAHDLISSMPQSNEALRWHDDINKIERQALLAKQSWE